MLGERIGSYEVLEEIGKGGMATVYRARQASVDREGRSIDGLPEARGGRLSPAFDRRDSSSRPSGGLEAGKVLDLDAMVQEILSELQ